MAMKHTLSLNRGNYGKAEDNLMKAILVSMGIALIGAVFGVAIAIKEDKKTKFREENQAQEIESATEEVKEKEIIKEDERPVKFCENCGTELKDGETKCPSCGTDIK